MRKRFSILLTAFVAILFIVIPFVRASGQSFTVVFIPMVMEGNEPPVIPTPLPTDIPTPTDPVQVGSTIRFKGWESEINLSGVVVSSEFQSILTPDYGDPEIPGGKFLVVVLDVTNTGLESDSVGMYTSFKARDLEGRHFDLADLTAQMAAEDQYDLDSVYTSIQPGFTKRLVFAFDVLPASQTLTLVSQSPW